MLNKKRALFLIFTLLLSILAFAGCNNKNEGAKEGTTTPTAAPTTAPTASATATPAPTATPVPVDYSNASLKDTYADYFKMGVILNGRTVTDPKIQELVKTNFNSVTTENEMKPESLLDYQTSISDPKYDESPATNFRNADPILKFAKDNGIKMRGHTLVWHSQTPRWLFTEGYSQKPDAPFVSREKMLKRMENYIKQVMEYANTNYPGVIYAWDVVNEAINPSDGQADGLRTTSSLWYQVVGDDYIEKAFEYARKYAAPDQKLFYNDYGTEDPTKMSDIIKLVQKIKTEGNIDGIGMQTHITTASPNLMQIDSSARKYAELGLELQVTELDMNTALNTEDEFTKQATRYKRLFLYFKKWKDDGINLSCVTFWGVSDNQSWLNAANKPAYPLLFNADLSKKPAFFGVLQDPSIPLY